MKGLCAPPALAMLCSTASIAIAADGVAETTGMTGMAGTSLASHSAKQKVVYHVNCYGTKKQADALRNIQNHINAAGVGSALFRSSADWTGEEYGRRCARLAGVDFLDTRRRAGADSRHRWIAAKRLCGD